MRVYHLSAAAAFFTAHAAARSVVDKTSLTFLFQNNLNPLDDENHVGAILLDPMTGKEGAALCANLDETLLPIETITEHAEDFLHQLRYLEFSGQVGVDAKFFIANGTLSIPPLGLGDKPHIEPLGPGNPRLSVLCTQSNKSNSTSTSSTAASNQVSVRSKRDGNTYVGYRNLKSFRFLGIPYANPPSRFEYSTVYDKCDQTIDAQNYGVNCPQDDDMTTSEDCLFLNIQTPYLPKTGKYDKLRPVLFTIHGGAYTGGNGGSEFDAGNFASREDIVGVSINYRLSTLGFLAIPGTDIKGNFGIGDQVTALRWVRKNIALFGGDPERITIIGESAGAGSVKALLGSPPVIRENLIVGAIAQSNLGGGAGMGPGAAYSTPYSSYYTIEESYAIAGQQIFHEAGCNQTELSEQIQCLKTTPAQTVVDLDNVARFVVQDGHFVNSKELNVANRNGSTAHVNVIFGTTADDGTMAFQWPQGDFISEADFITAALEINRALAESIIDSNLFPMWHTGNLTLDAFNVSQRVVTDVGFRCVDEAIVYGGSHSKVFKSAYYYTFDRGYGGYDPNNVGASGLANGPIEPGYPHGNPNKPYFRLHGSELPFTYGNVDPVRDENDIKAAQLVTGYFASFAKTGNPNPSDLYLRVRGYEDTIHGIQESGPWLPVSGKTGPAKSLDYPARTGDFPDLAQCAWLKYPITFYLD
ncbi:hypothetical protein FQN50_000114 [Emmonsiellopsis sp. PD_5]|nr:hypothetical protein FQN50_000114 [Emmonsiellopsis sp. PD_5]